MEGDRDRWNRGSTRCHKPSLQPTVSVGSLQNTSAFWGLYSISWKLQIVRMVYYGLLMFIVRSTEKNNLFASVTAYGLARQRRRPIYATGCHQPKQIEEPPPGGCDTRVLGFSRDVGNMVKTWMKHDETIKHGGKMVVSQFWRIGQRKCRNMVNKMDESIKSAGKNSASSIKQCEDQWFNMV